MKKLMTVLLLGFAFSTFIAAKDIGGISLPDTLDVGGTSLGLNGAGLRTKLFFKVYAGGLYLRTPSRNAAEIIAGDEPMAIRLHFLMNVDAKSILDAWNEGFRNSAGSSYGVLASSMERFNSCFSEDSKKDTIYDIIYTPGEGISVLVGGVVKAVIPGKDFKSAVFGIWLGDKPADKDLRKGMLAN